MNRGISRIKSLPQANEIVSRHILAFSSYRVTKLYTRSLCHFWYCTRHTNIFSFQENLFRLLHPCHILGRGNVKEHDRLHLSTVLMNS